jgi:hypothetical protein
VAENAISSILISRVGGANIGGTIDDLGFTEALAVPEPASTGTLIAAAASLFSRRHRTAE